MFIMLTSIFLYLISLFVGAVVIGIMCIYIIRDTRKYKMNTLFWGIVTVLLQFIGICLYWRSRKKLLSKRCPVCRAQIPEHKDYCILCGVELDTVRPKNKSFGRFLIKFCAFFEAIFIIEHFLRMYV